MKHIKALLFDKDGTLFDFQATWGTWAERMIAELAGADEALQSAIADALKFDLSTHRFLPRSPVIAGTGSEVTALIAPLLPGTDIARLEARIARAASHAPLVSPVPLRPLLLRLRRAGYRLGVATNDYESVARDHIRAVDDLFNFVAGFDSGFGGKPGPGMLLAFANACGVPPSQVLMIGDSTHDLMAGRAAGMSTLAVLTGVATASDLMAWADEILPDIGHLPDFLGVS
jgi:phosphoglycolate phosphatase